MATDRYSDKQLDEIAKAVLEAADPDADHDPAPVLTRWADERLGDDDDMDRIVRERRARRSGEPGDDEIGKARTAKRDRKVS